MSYYYMNFNCINYLSPQQMDGLDITPLMLVSRIWNSTDYRNLQLIVKLSVGSEDNESSL